MTLREDLSELHERIQAAQDAGHSLSNQLCVIVTGSELTKMRENLNPENLRVVDLIIQASNEYVEKARSLQRLLEQIKRVI